MQSDIVLFKNKENCCGCGACMQLCPKNAIKMREDECGFIYPKINYEICIGCGKCKSSCAFQNKIINNSPQKTFAAVSKDSEIVKKSASGGVFASLAKKFINDKGIVFGASFCDEWNVKHIKVDNIDDLIKLQGSKYTQSSTEKTYSEAKKLLKKGIKVLYSGTPCQIAGLYGYLGNDYDNLITVDLVCHGVPNNRMFKEYLYFLENKEHGKIKQFTFRDKNIGWGINGSAVILKKDSEKIKKILQSASSYFFYFSQGLIYRDSCYKCKYACSHRPADLTLGDYWGIEKVHPEYLGNNGWNESKGISVVIANTIKGIEFLNKNQSCFEMKKSDFEKASEGNLQLRRPSEYNIKREEILEIYMKNGWQGIEARFNKNIGIRKYNSFIKSFIPVSLKRLLKKYIKQ